ncbi:MAG: hypothetical protein A3K19_12930 [Lentisphaerae bacterium RIFOXYB12_FULL_65_16]|nr:MAG: hypothetical protein A3K19_12930 [Lentisphaerae bacterium RIFOXYB12_FULL_65_16]
MWLTPVPTPEELRAVYGEGYFANDHFMSGQDSDIYGYYDYLAERFDRQSGYVDFLREVRSGGFTGGEKPARLLDIGCGFGFLLDVAQDEGFQVEGVEFNERVVATAKAKYSFPIYCGDVADFPGKGYDVITMFDVIEHVLDPFAVIEKCCSMVRVGGLVVIVTMDSDSPVSLLFGKRLEDFRRVREHLTFWTRRSIGRLLEERGFGVKRIRYYGHTFKLGFLAKRVSMCSAALGWLPAKAVAAFGIADVRIRLNPLTKMMVLAVRER